MRSVLHGQSARLVLIVGQGATREGATASVDPKRAWSVKRGLLEGLYCLLMVVRGNVHS